MPKPYKSLADFLTIYRKIKIQKKSKKNWIFLFGVDAESFSLIKDCKVGLFKLKEQYTGIKKSL